MSKAPGTGLYLVILHSTVGKAYEWLPSTRWIQFVKGRSAEADTPRWAPEVFQLVFLTLGLGLLVAASPSSSGVLTFVMLAVLGVRLLDVFVFSLYWVFIDDHKVESHRRSLAAFSVSVFEVPVLFTAISILSGCCSLQAGTWRLLYENLSALMSLSVPDMQPGSLPCSLIAHFALVLEGILLLVVLTAVVGTISRPERTTDKTPD